jgi:uncharacterized protein involved in exopolysaccharide biosynthesis
MDLTMDVSVNPWELIRVVWRRKWFFITPAVLVLAVAAAAIVLVPPLYRSDATILVERQEMPEDVVPSLANEEIDRRLQVITNRVLVTQNLIEIADRHDLYAADRDVLSREAIADRMRERIDTQTMITEFNDESSGRRGQATVGFQVSFLDPDPRVARAVTDDLVSTYLVTNLEQRRAVAERTTEFLAGERAALDERIAGLEDELAAFKTANRELLPQEAAFKRRALTELGQRLDSTERDLRVLRERESYLATQLALTEEFDADGAGGRTTPASQLALLRTELATARARYRSTHPDVVRLEREVRSLEALVGAEGSSAALAASERELTTRLATLRERYTDDHPDVRRVRRELAAVRRTRAEAESGGGPTAPGVDRNPTFVRLSAELNSVRAEIAAIGEQRDRLRAQRAALQDQLARTPDVEREYNRLVRRLENAVADREELADKEATVRLSGSMESTEAGERLTLIEPPSLQDSPAQPNKRLILAIGIVLSVASGGTSLAIAQFFDRSIRSARDLSRLVGDVPLCAIPMLLTPGDRRRRWRRRGAVVAVTLLVLAGALFWVHTRVTPLDLLGYEVSTKVEQRLERWFPALAD